MQNIPLPIECLINAKPSVTNSIPNSANPSTPATNLKSCVKYHYIKLISFNIYPVLENPAEADSFNFPTSTRSQIVRTITIIAAAVVVNLVINPISNSIICIYIINLLIFYIISFFQLSRAYYIQVL